MPQVDLEPLVSACPGGGSDRKITSETLADKLDDSSENDDAHNAEPSARPETPPDFPPESFWLSKDAELDWFSHNAFYERKDSTKGVSQATSTHKGPNSQRFSLRSTSKASIIGLPKAQKANYADAKKRNANGPLFPKRTGVIGKTISSLTEPSSPKVSCMGRVRSKRRSRRSSEPGRKRDTPVERSGSRREKKKTGFCSGLLMMLKGGKGNKKPVQKEGSEGKLKPTAVEVSRKVKSASKRARDFPVGFEPVAEPPGLGGMKRFASGRRGSEDLIG